MPKRFVYPTANSIKTMNEIVNLTSTKKADSFKMLRADEFLENIIQEVRDTGGDVYDKAAVLLRRIIVTHVFASGNKRTGFIVSAYFIEENGGRILFKDIDKLESILRNIRLYSEKEISNWLRSGDIDESRLKR